MLAQLKDRLWVYQAKRGNKQAFGRLYTKYLEQIYRYIFFKVNQNREDAEDLTEVVFMRAWTGLAGYEDKGNFRAWVYTIAHNAVIDHYKSHNKSILLTEEIADDKINHEEMLIHKEGAEGLKEAIEKLTDEQKAVVTMKFIDDLENEEIAKILGKDEDAIRALQYRALKKLSKMLKTKI